jgi:hypothetical protein
MRRVTIALVFLTILGFALPLLAQGNQVVLGILPVYDSTAERYGNHLAPNITYMLFQHFQGAPNIQPVLLSPGGLYEPTADDWITEYAQKSKVDAVLLATLLPSVKEGERHRYLQFEVQLLDVASGKRSGKASNGDVKVSLLDLGFADTTHRNIWGQGQVFARQPLGKAAAKLVDWTEYYVRTTLPRMSLAASGLTAPAPASCQVQFRVRYKQRNSSSKVYSLIANDKEESATINEGVARFPATSGLLAIQVHVEDAPLRMPTQDLYQSSTTLDCGSSNHTLVLELGSAGEGFLRWEY